jgi:hypothetical protein
LNSLPVAVAVATAGLLLSVRAGLTSSICYTPGGIHHGTTIHSVTDLARLLAANLVPNAAC